jgi:hypothetical protein
VTSLFPALSAAVLAANMGDEGRSDSNLPEIDLYLALDIADAATEAGRSSEIPLLGDSTGPSDATTDIAAVAKRLVEKHPESSATNLEVEDALREAKFSQHNT